MGPLFVIGGAEDREGDCHVLRALVRLAGGPSGSIVVIAVASDTPGDVGSLYVRLFQRLGAATASLLDLPDRLAAADPTVLDQVDGATAVFFSGGDQSRITRAIAGTPLAAGLHRRHRHGLVVAGTSAGAAVMSETMITGGGSAPRPDSVELAPGMGFLPGVILDQHFRERDRLPRLLAAIARYPTELGIGIDEDTAVVVRESRLAVLGKGSATVVDVRRTGQARRSGPTSQAAPVIGQAAIVVLTDGMSYDLDAGAISSPKPIVDTGESEPGY